MDRNIFVTSDHHFGHTNIIEYAERPFRNTEEMDVEMIEKWNERVKWCDVVYHLGDFTLRNADTAAKYFARLNGIIIVLRNQWHHDKRWLPKNPQTTICTYLMSKTETPVSLTSPITVLERSMTGLQRPIVLCHYEMTKWDRSHYGSLHFYGHDHVSFAPFGKKMNVGVDAHGFYPLNIKMLYDNIEEGGW